MINFGYTFRFENFFHRWVKFIWWTFLQPYNITHWTGNYFLCGIWVYKTIKICLFAHSRSGVFLIRYLLFWYLSDVLFHVKIIENLYTKNYYNFECLQVYVNWMFYHYKKCALILHSVQWILCIDGGFQWSCLIWICFFKIHLSCAPNLRYWQYRDWLAWCN